MVKHSPKFHPEEVVLGYETWCSEPKLVRWSKLQGEWVDISTNEFLKLDSWVYPKDVSLEALEDTNEDEDIVNLKMELEPYIGKDKTLYKDVKVDIDDENVIAIIIGNIVIELDGDDWRWSDSK